MVSAIPSGSSPITPEQSDASLAQRNVSQTAPTTPPPSTTTATGSTQQNRFTQHDGRGSFLRNLESDRTLSELLGLEARAPSRIWSSQRTDLDSARIFGLGATALGTVLMAMSLEKKDPKLGALGAGLVALGVSTAVIIKILHNAALVNQLYGMEKGTDDAKKIKKIVGQVVEAVPEDQQDAALEYLAKNWDSLVQNFSRAVSPEMKTAQFGTMLLVNNGELKKALGLNSDEEAKKAFTFDPRSIEEKQHTLEFHQELIVLQLKDVDGARKKLGRGTVEQRDRVTTIYAPKLAEAENEIRKANELGMDTDAGKAAIERFRAIALGIAEDAERDHDVAAEDAEGDHKVAAEDSGLICHADYNDMMKILRTLYWEIPPDEDHER